MVSSTGQSKSVKATASLKACYKNSSFTRTNLAASAQSAYHLPHQNQQWQATFHLLGQSSNLQIVTQHFNCHVAAVVSLSCELLAVLSRCPL